MNEQIQESPIENGEEGVTLSRNLSLFSIIMIGVGGMIGAGIFVLTGTAAGVAGPAVILAFILNGIVTLFTAAAYAELGSAYPEAGGGYLWVKEGLGNLNGFLAGWMDWFAHVVVGTLYALAFGRFATEMMLMAGLDPLFGLSIHQQSLIFTGLIVGFFTFLNAKGSSETTMVGNVVTMTKIVILGFFIIFGMKAMFNTADWPAVFLDDFMPYGAWGIFTAMGIIFIGFEGYEIISQSSEEAINPKRNIPRAIFWSIGIVVVIYVLVGITAIGSVQPPAGMTAYTYLGEKKEIAIIEVAGQTFPWGAGRVLLLISGLVSTMSALNATTFSSSRVSFAMGREHNLPPIFAKVHPKNFTPYMAVIFSGSLMLIFGLFLPIDDVAAAAAIMFLLLFLQVNVAVMTLRKKRPDLDRGFITPWFPFIPIVAIVLNAFLALNLFSFSPIAWYVAIAWLIVGALAYFGYFSQYEAQEKPKEILLEEVLVRREYSVMVPVETEREARIVGQVGAVLAQENLGDVHCLHVIKVPKQLTLGEGRHFLKQARPLLDTVIDVAKPHDVPVHTSIRLGRSRADAIRKTVVENASDLLLLGWSGETGSKDRFFGSVIDPLLDDPPCEMAVMRYRKQRPLHSILVPVAGGVNSRLAVRLAVQMAQAAEEGPAIVTLMQVVPKGASEGLMIRSEQVLSRSREGFDYTGFLEVVREGDNIVETIISESLGSEEYEPYDLIVIGASNEPLFRNLLAGNVAAQIAQRAKVSVLIAKRRSSPLHSFLRQTVLPSSSEQVLKK
jgi:basic amino acid/polyamine antiporter, APA family